MPQYGDAAFAVVIDKGTLDAIMCGKRAEADAAAMVLECHRYAPTNWSSGASFLNCYRKDTWLTVGRTAPWRR